MIWSDDALREFDRAIEHIARDNGRAATLVADRIENAVKRLGELPTGRLGRVTGTYEKFVSRTSYIVAYALTDRTLTILHVIHAKRDWPDDAWPED